MSQITEHGIGWSVWQRTEMNSGLSYNTEPRSWATKVTLHISTPLYAKWRQGIMRSNFTLVEWDQCWVWKSCTKKIHHLYNPETYEEGASGGKILLTWYSIGHHEHSDLIPILHISDCKTFPSKAKTRILLQHPPSWIYFLSPCLRGKLNWIFDLQFCLRVAAQWLKVNQEWVLDSEDRVILKIFVLRVKDLGCERLVMFVLDL